MASIIRHGDKWRALVNLQGTRKSKVFPTKRQAQEWAARLEFTITNAEIVAAETKLREVLDRYAREVSPKKRGHRWEVVRLEKIGRDRIADISLGELSAKDFADWRDRRLTEVAPGTVAREMTLLGSVMTTARREWELIAKNPLSDVSKPRAPAPRDRLPTEGEIERMALVAGDDLSYVQARAFHAFLFACETAMRAGEIVGLTWDRLDLDRRVARLEKTKNGRPREVPLSSRAIELIKQLPENDPVFGLTSRQLDVMFRKIRGLAAVEGLTFHDSRAFATSKLSRKLEVLELAKVTGHTDLNMLIRVYYRTSAEDLAKRLD